MSLVEPGIGVTTSTTWAAYINANFSTLDGHNHAAGSGVQIQPNGLNINVNLPFQGNSATGLNSVAFAGAVTGTPSTLSVYSNGTDLFYKDSGNNSIQLTKSGGPNAGTGNIQNLPSTPIGGAGISWINSTATFQFLLDAGTAGANADIGSLILRYPGSYPTPTGSYIALEVPTSLSASYSLMLPTALPSVYGLMTVSSTGVLTTLPLTSGTIGSSYQIAQVNSAGTSLTFATQIQQANLPTINKVLSSSSSSYTSTSTTLVAVTGLSASITTSGRPVAVTLVPDNTTAAFLQTTSDGPTALFSIQINRDSGSIYLAQFQNQAASTGGIIVAQMLPGAVFVLDTPSAGAHTYQVFVATGLSTGSAVSVNNCKLQLYEL
jgi:hypothetical protein